MFTWAWFCPQEILGECRKLPSAELSHPGRHKMHTRAHPEHLPATFHHMCDEKHPSTSGVGTFCPILDNSSSNPS